MLLGKKMEDLKAIFKFVDRSRVAVRGITGLRKPIFIGRKVAG